MLPDVIIIYALEREPASSPCRVYWFLLTTKWSYISKLIASITLSWYPWCNPVWLESAILLYFFQLWIPPGSLSLLYCPSNHHQMSYSPWWLLLTTDITCHWGWFCKIAIAQVIYVTCLCMQFIHWKWDFSANYNIMPTLPSVVASEVVVMTTCDATSNDKVSIVTSFASVHYIETLLICANWSASSCWLQMPWFQISTRPSWHRYHVTASKQNSRGWQVWPISLLLLMGSSSHTDNTQCNKYCGIASSV